MNNPRLVSFVPSDDHDQIDHYELDAIPDGSTAVVRTYDVGKPPVVDGRVTATVNVQNMPFGSYRFVGRAEAGALQSDPSVPSDVWQRVPGKPGQPVTG